MPLLPRSRITSLELSATIRVFDAPSSRRSPSLRRSRQRVALRRQRHHRHLEPGEGSELCGSGPRALSRTRECRRRHPSSDKGRVAQAHCSHLVHSRWWTASRTESRGDTGTRQRVHTQRVHAIRTMMSGPSKPRARLTLTVSHGAYLRGQVTTSEGCWRLHFWSGSTIRTFLPIHPPAAEEEISSDPCDQN